jgi:hypothetical protein
MGSNVLMSLLRSRAVALSLGGFLAGVIILGAALAAAQDAAKPQQAESQGFFAKMGQWWDQTTENWNAGVSGVRKRFENFGQQAGVAARTTVDSAKDAADALGRLPNARVVQGHEKCKVAPNGAPDCVAAAAAMCKAKGFANGGASLDMTTAEVCPAKVYLSGRNTGEGCHTETFVSRVLCQ